MGSAGRTNAASNHKWNTGTRDGRHTFDHGVQCAKMQRGKILQTVVGRFAGATVEGEAEPEACQRCVGSIFVTNGGR